MTTDRISTLRRLTCVSAAIAITATAATSSQGALTALYELDGTSSAVADSAGDNPGSIKGSPTRGADGVFGNAFNFSGGNNGVNLGTDPAVQPTGSFTNTFWLNASDASDSARYDRFVGGGLSKTMTATKAGAGRFSTAPVSRMTKAAPRLPLSDSTMATASRRQIRVH